MRPIDADALMDMAYQISFDHRISERELAIVNYVMMKMPTIETVPVIRCENCKYKRIENLVYTCPFGMPGGPSFYCGYGAWEEE